MIDIKRILETLKDLIFLLKLENNFIPHRTCIYNKNKKSFVKHLRHDNPK